MKAAKIASQIKCFMRFFAAAFFQKTPRFSFSDKFLRPPSQVCHRLLASLRENLRRSKPCPGQSAHLYHRKPEPPHPVLPGPPQAPDAQLQQVQRKSGRQHPVFYRHQRWRGTDVKNIINTYLAISASATSGSAGVAIPPIGSVWFSTIWRFHGK